MKFPIALVLPCLVILLWAVACAGTQQSALAPTLDVEATVQARLTEERAIEATVVAKAQAMAKVIVEATAQAAPTATPIPPTPKSAYSPMLDDYMVGASSIFYRTGFSTAEIRQRQKDRIVQVYDQFASAYVGRACVDRAELNSGEFRSFVAQTVGRETADGTVIGLVAEDLISEMLTRVEGGTETNCMRPFLYPETGAELALAYGLVKAAGLARVNRYLRANTKGGARIRNTGGLIRNQAQGGHILSGLARKANVDSTAIMSDGGSMYWLNCLRHTMVAAITAPCPSVPGGQAGFRGRPT